jgi:hypothetical protein
MRRVHSLVGGNVLMDALLGHLIENVKGKEEGNEDCLGCLDSKTILLQCYR